MKWFAKETVELLESGAQKTNKQMIYLGLCKQQIIDSNTKKLIREREGHFVIEESKVGPPVFESYKDWIINYNNTWIPTSVSPVEEVPKEINKMTDNEVNKFIKKFNTVERMKSIAKNWYLSLTKI